MIIKKAELETVCGVTSTFPQNDHPEFAFAGKSNVGKSSLINGLLNRKALARTSSQPVLDLRCPVSTRKQSDILSGAQQISC